MQEKRGAGDDTKSGGIEESVRKCCREENSIMKKLETLKNRRDFFNYIENRDCICFGAGMQLDETCLDVPELINKIACVLDNNSNLHGTNRRVGNRRIPIRSSEYLTECNPEKMILIITSSYKNEILMQLNLDRRYDEIPYTDFFDIMDMAAWGAKTPDADFRKNLVETIPRTLHYIWFSDKPIPNELQENIEGWKRLCPDYEVKCWNEKNYDVSTNKYMYDAYKKKRWSFVSDYARLDIVYQYGGIYFYTDVELVRRPDELLFNDAFIGFERLSTVNTGSGFGARAGFPLIRQMRDHYENVEFTNRANANEMILCPVYETAILEKHGLKRNGDFQVVANMSVYPVMYFNAKSLYSDRLRITDRTISIHKCAWSWAGAKSKIREFREEK